MADMKDKKEETIHQEEEAVKAEDVTETAETAESAESTETSEAEQAQESAGEKKSFFDKKKDKKTAALEEKLADLEDKRVRQLAEFENFRKRSEKEKSQIVVEKMLPVIDNFERGLLAVAEEDKESPFVQGMELVYKQMLTAFDALGVKPIDAVGKEFDPNLHNAVMMVDDDALESGTVAEEMQKGYMYKDSVVRHSMVKVVN